MAFCRARRLTRRTIISTLARLGAGITVPAFATLDPWFARPNPHHRNALASVIVSGLANPRGLAWDAAGSLHIALGGPGGISLKVDENQVSVVRIEHGCAVPVARGLPSTNGMGGHAQGPSALAFINDELYILQDAGATSFLASDFPNGVYAVNAEGHIRLVADISAWIKANPVANVPADYYPNGETFGMAVVSNALWIVESNSGQILEVTTGGTISRVADLSADHLIPTGPAASPAGGIYVGFLTPAPYVDRSSRVIEVTSQGTVHDVWTGLTMVTAVAVDPDGMLYALEMSTGNGGGTSSARAHSGRIVRQSGRNECDDVAVGLPLPIAMAFGPDNSLYVSAPAYAETNEEGFVLRVPASANQVPDIRYLNVNDVTCAAPRADP